jgi:hypothetical protein
MPRPNINPHDLETLDLFCRKAKELEQSSTFNKGRLSTKFTINYHQGQALSLSGTGPDGEPFIAFLTIFRQFYAEREAINYFKICNVAWKYMTTPERKLLAQYRDNYRKRIHNPGNMYLSVDNRPLVAKEIIDLWFNALVFHTNPSKRKKLETHLKSWAGPLLKHLFQSHVIGLAIIIMNTAVLIACRILTEPPLPHPHLHED